MNLTERWKTFREFLVDVRKETGKVSWPARDEVVGTTTVVIIYTAVVGVYLFAVDAMITPVINWFFASFGG
ncbi:MAG: preprotein translocase subunit SecE [Thermoanaerobaculia bacterium]|nr:preprotein translocase subunit SecE [Thermoanaerobaculia bacterium]